jgi:hypothetical protein
MIGTPKWSDKEQVAEFVSNEFDAPTPREMELEIEMSLHMPDLTLSSLEPFRERAALQAAQQGDFSRLAERIRRGHTLDPIARELVANKLLGKSKRPRGRPRLNIEDRDNSLRYAAQEFPRIREILRRHWPKERGQHDRALEIAVKRWAIPDDESNTATDKLNNLVRRSKDDRRR